MNDYKLYIIVRTDREFSRGKLMVHIGHICVEMTRECGDWIKYDDWATRDQTKIILNCKNEEELEKYYRLAWNDGIFCSKIKDLGFYEVEKGALIMIGIFCNEEEAKKIGLKKLSLFK